MADPTINPLDYATPAPRRQQFGIHWGGWALLIAALSVAAYAWWPR
jgi:hypothetical protein